MAGVMMGLPRAEALELAAQSELPHNYLDAGYSTLNQLFRELQEWLSNPVHTQLILKMQ